MRGAALFVFFVACARPLPSAAPSSAASSTPEPTEPIKVGDHIVPLTGSPAIPVRGAKLTMVSYFATWCEASKRWIPHVEAMKQKYAAAGLVVVGVANVDEAPQALLEQFVTTYGGTYPVFTDHDRRVQKTLPPSNWGQQIIVVDPKGTVRLVHRGTQEGAFAKVDAEVAQLLAQ